MALRAERGGSDPEHVLFLDPFEIRLRNVVVELTHGVLGTGALLTVRKPSAQLRTTAICESVTN